MQRGPESVGNRHLRLCRSRQTDQTHSLASFLLPPKPGPPAARDSLGASKAITYLPGYLQVQRLTCQSLIQFLRRSAEAKFGVVVVSSPFCGCGCACAPVPRDWMVLVRSRKASAGHFFASRISEPQVRSRQRFSVACKIEIYRRRAQTHPTISTSSGGRRVDSRGFACRKQATGCLMKRTRRHCETATTNSGRRRRQSIKVTR